MVLTSLKSPMKLSFSGRSLGTKKTWFFFFLSESDEEKVCVCLIANVFVCVPRWPYHSLYSSGKRISPLYKVAVCKLIGHRAMWQRSFEPLYCVIKSWLDFWHACGCELECTSDTDSWVDHLNCIVNMLSLWLCFYHFSLIINVLYDYTICVLAITQMLCFAFILLCWIDVYSFSILKHSSRLMEDKPISWVLEMSWINEICILGVVIKSLTPHHLHLHWRHSFEGHIINCERTSKDFTVLTCLAVFWMAFEFFFFV